MKAPLRRGLLYASNELQVPRKPQDQQDQQDQPDDSTTDVHSALLPMAWFVGSTNACRMPITAWGGSSITTTDSAPVAYPIAFRVCLTMMGA
jgi:hypothetical protein